MFLKPLLGHLLVASVLVLAACDDDGAVTPDHDTLTDAAADTSAPDATGDTAATDLSDTDASEDDSTTPDLDAGDTAADVDTADSTADTTDATSDVDTTDADVVDPTACPAPPSDLPVLQADRYGRWDVVEAFPGASHGLLERKVEVFLPADYDTSSARYPVLYMHDGQNLFDAAQAAFGVEWQVDETLDALLAAGTLSEPWIVVAVHATADRIGDYTPDVDPDYGGGNGVAYTDLLTDRIKPWVEANYRVKCGASSTALAGSSLGGLISLHIAMAHPDAFGRVAAISPSFWWNERSIVTGFATAASPLPERLWLDAGGAEGTVLPTGASTTIANVNAVRDGALGRGGQYGQDLAVLEIPDGEHNEAAWAARLPDILAWLLTDTDLSTATADAGELVVYDRWLSPGEASHAALTLDFDTAADTRVTWLPSATTWTIRDPGVLDPPGASLDASSVGATLVTASARGASDEAFVEVDDDFSDATVRFEVVVPAATSQVHVSGNRASLGDFDGVGVSMTQLAAGSFTTEVAVPLGLLEYKYTQGSWATVEKGPAGEELANRSRQVDGPVVVRDTVATWAL